VTYAKSGGTPSFKILSTDGNDIGSYTVHIQAEVYNPYSDDIFVKDDVSFGLALIYDSCKDAVLSSNDHLASVEVKFLEPTTISFDQFGISGNSTSCGAIAYSPNAIIEYTAPGSVTTTAYTVPIDSVNN